MSDRTAIVLRREATTIACPFGDCRPVPCGPAANGPLGFGEHASLSPDVDGVALHAKSFGDLDESHGLAVVHGDHCTESLDICLLCTDNQYMTNHSTTIKPSESNTMFELHCSTCGLLTRDFSHWSLSRMAEMHERPNATLADAPDEPEAGAFLRPDEEARQ